MDYKIVTDFTTFTTFKGEWNRILSQSAIDVPFLTFEYQQAWWDTRGGGEWPQTTQLFLVAAFEDEKLVGLAPLFFGNNILGNPALMLVGAIEVSDFLDFIVRPQDLGEFVHGLIDFLLQADLPQWDLFDFHNLLGDSSTMDILENEAQSRGWSFQKFHLQPSPYIPLPGSFEDYLAQIDKKQRHEIRRKLRNVDQNLVTSNLYITQDEDKLEADVQAFIEMMAQDPNKSDFLTGAMRHHIHNTARVAFNQGWLQLSFLILDGQKAAANMSFIYKNRIWLYNSGWEWQLREYSPGWVLLAHLIEWATQNGVREFDFMRGDEPYKYKFGGIDRHVYRVTVKRK